jgi:uncharacterized protein YdeI (YjbR/CyaY-like superfamily)
MFRARGGVWLWRLRSNLDNAAAALVFRSARFPMGRKDPRVDAYIAKAAPFAQPILKHIRDLVHTGCPEVTETMKWSMPHFDYKGMFIGMAAHKAHCSLGFWREAALALGGNGEETDSMGQFGRITSVADLPDAQTLIGYVRKAVELKDAGVKLPPASRSPAKAQPLEVPDYLAARLKRNAKAQKTWDAFSPSHRKEYLAWLSGAKRAETREKRLALTLDQLTEGKRLNWKYERR